MRKRRRAGLLLAVIVAVICVLLAGCGGGARSTGESSQPAASRGAQSESAGNAANSESNEQTGKSGKSEQDTATKTAVKVAESGTYTSKDEVAAYLYEFGHLPSNFITKDEAEDAGWKTGGRSLDEACPGKSIGGDKFSNREGKLPKAKPGKSIGGDKFSNREGKLPKAKGRTWTECDIDYHGEKSRGAKRIVFSNDGLIYYTGDHYKTFELLYGKES